MSVIKNVSYEINEDGNCVNCKCVDRLHYCKAFGSGFICIRKINGVFEPDQLQACKEFIEEQKGFPFPTKLMSVDDMIKSIEIMTDVYNAEIGASNG